MTKATYHYLALRTIFEESTSPKDKDVLDPVIEAMTVLWSKMSEKEREQIRRIFKDTGEN